MLEQPPPPFTIATASVPRRRREFVATGEGLAPPLFFLDSWVRQGLIKLVLLQVLIPGAVGAAPRPHQSVADPPSLPSFLTGAFEGEEGELKSEVNAPVSDNTRSISLRLVHFGVSTSSPEQPRRPLPVPAADEARSPPLTPRSRAHAPPLRFALVCGCVDGRERNPGVTPASPRAAPPLSGDAAAASRLPASSALRSRADG
jgi:hypothetical protein